MPETTIVTRGAEDAPRRGPGPPPGERTPSLASLLERHRGALLRLVRRSGSGLLRYEGAEDLVQGIHLNAVSVSHLFEYRGEKPFLAWLSRLARQHIARRHRFWSALRRRAGDVARITRTASTHASRADPPAPGPGPSTIAASREDFALAMKAFAVLLPRDQNLVRWSSEDVPLDEIARRLDLSHEAAKRARSRALERYRQLFAALSSEGDRIRRRS